jgi:hypothetical protein
MADVKRVAKTYRENGQKESCRACGLSGLKCNAAALLGQHKASL